MDNIKRLGNQISVPIEADEEGFTGRECPECEGYFKIEFGTGLEGEDLPCRCPYCGHSASHDEFWTKAQIEYAQSVALHTLSDALHKDLKAMEFETKPKGPFGIGISMKVKPGRPIPIHYYREEDLETEITCESCTLRYSVFGVFGFCPDCGQHNSLQILNSNLDLIGKMIALAGTSDAEISEKLIENSLEDCVSAFDGFGREWSRVYASRSNKLEKDKALSFQNLEKANAQLNKQFGMKLDEAVGNVVWRRAITGFQKRHLLAHKMGVIDQEYIDRSGDNSLPAGRKVRVTSTDLTDLVDAIRKLAEAMMNFVR